ncbi:MAG: hypothetical protein JNK89_00380, partial [Saprospiraceae bacterium]|nr:hypothetical protein [Saprospiraceae bacterium]
FPQAEFAPVTSSCNDNGAITCLNPNPQYRFLWGSGDTTASRTNLASGVYSLTVTDLLTGCARGYTFVVPQLQQALVGDSRTNPFCEFKNGSITLSPIPPSAQISYAWTGPNGFSSNLAAINGLDSGTYIVTLTNLNSGCSQVNTYKLVRTGPPVSSMWISEALCDNVLAIETAGGGFTFDWGAGPTPGTGPVTELALPPGTYAITLTSGSGCTGMKTVVIPPNSPPCTYVFGKVRLDEAQNCQTNFDEPGLFAWFLTAESATDTFFARTDTAGNYRMRAVPGNYTVHLVQQGFQPFVCQNDVPVSLLQAGDSVQTDFLVQVPNAACPDLSIQLTAPVLRRCFSNNFYYLHYCNQSPLEVPDAYFTLKLDPLLGLQDAAIPFTDLGNNQYQFQLGTLPPNFCGDVWVRILVSCSAVLGQTLCSEANIYPDSLCVPPPPQWSGAHLEVRSECLGDSLFFIFKNIGSGAMPGLLDYIVIEDGIMSRQGSAAPLQAGQTMTVGLPATGATWRIEAPQVAFSPRPDQPWLSVEGCTSSGSFSTGFVNQFPLGASGQQTDVDCTVVTGAYDPNDKQGFPEGYGPAGYIRPGTELEYLIRFQNTGTDTAFAVVIRDTLSPWLDPLSVRPGASSHSYRFELTGSGILIFDFQDILLPDSNVNEAASHGFVRFNISPRVDVPLETDVLNRAAIYFDFNQPVLTNTTWHRIGINFVSVGLWQPGQAAYQVRIAPHPLRDASWLALDLPAGTSSSGEFRLEIFNAPGSRVAQEQAPEPRFLLRKNQLAAGVYGFTVSAGGKILGAGKLVVQ